MERLCLQGKVKYMESVGGEGLLDGERVLDLKQAIYTSRQKLRRTQEEVKVHIKITLEMLLINPDLFLSWYSFL